MQRNTKQCKATQSNAKQHEATRSNAKQHKAIPTNTKQCSATQARTEGRTDALAKPDQTGPFWVLGSYVFCARRGAAPVVIVTNIFFAALMRNAWGELSRKLPRCPTHGKRETVGQLCTSSGPRNKKDEQNRRAREHCC